MKKLKPEQMLLIENFIQHKGYSYLDVQAEILDHLASEIEEKMEANPELSIETELQHIHSSFGIMGFSMMEDAAVKSISGRYRQFFWKSFFSLFGLRYILLVLLTFFLGYQLQVVLRPDTFYIFLLNILLILLALFKMIKISRTAFKKYLAYKISGFYLAFTGCSLSLTGLIINSAHGKLMGLNIRFLSLSILFTFFGIYLFAAFKTIRKGILECNLWMQKLPLAGEQPPGPKE